ncbi:fibronectin type III domain-containing protein [Actinocorallia longicatena]|uniref:Fibronectin type-III domain-containing protein n=1 Tax=Actinocorallia longicatena TaxID=111803 RepID=A0ABP6Q4Q7_9ACTN
MKRKRSRRLRRIAARVTVVAVLGPLLALPHSTRALAAGTLLFSQRFNNNTVDPAYPVSVPDLPDNLRQPNSVCLSALGNLFGADPKSCLTSLNSNGSGVLRLTNQTTNQEGGLFGAAAVPTSQGVDVTFTVYQHGGSNADGIAFVLAAVDPTNPVPPPTIGQPGGALGYSAATVGSSQPGLANAYMGVGFDVYGNFSNSGYQGPGCANPPYIQTGSGTVKGQVVIRGPGAGTTGYCALNSTATTTSSSALTLKSSTRAAAAIPAEAAINPTAATIVTDSGISVPPGTYKIVFTPIGAAKRTLSGTLPTVPPSLYPAANWLNANGIPKQIAFGFVGSTGGQTDFHEISDVTVTTFNPVPQLNVTQTAYVKPSPVPGDPVTYTVRPSIVAPGAEETQPVSVTETLPAGTVPVGAFGTGWTCSAPVGQKITCINGNTPFASGSSLPEITVVGIVTGTGVTPAQIRASSTAVVSSNDGNPAVASTAAAGLVPTAPSGLAAAPSSGAISGGGTVTITGSNTAGTNAIEIGTAAEQAAGTPVTLLPCPAGVTTGCFVQNGTTLTIPSMPPRSTPGAVTITVVTDGIAGTVPYTYTSVPGTPAAPAATAGATSATVSWTEPVTNGSPITGYVVTPFLNGLAQTPVGFDASTTTRTLTGLTAGGSYTFTVRAVNAVGTSVASPPSNSVVPYTVPGAPAITSVTAGSQEATLTFTPPAANGFSPITGYVITPYVAGVAQAPQTFSGTATTRTVTGLTAGTSYTFTVAAQNAAGTGPPSAPSAAVVPNDSPALTFPPPPDGQVGVAYSRPLTFTGGTAPYTWSVGSGSLPAGITLDPSTGLLSGTPTTPGTSAFTVRLTDSSGKSDSRAATLTVSASPRLTFDPPPAGQVGVPYDLALTKSGGTGPFVWEVSAGALPAGLSLDPATGVLSGTPTTAGTSAFTVRLTDSFGQSDTRPVNLVVGVGPIVITTTPNTTTAAPGSTVQYTLTVMNTGASAISGISVENALADVLDDASYNNDVVASQGTAGVSGGLLTWSGGLAGGATATITYSVTVKEAGSGNGVLADRVVSGTLGTNCPAGGVDTRCRATVNLQALTLVHTADRSTASPGDVVRYTVKVTNSGKSVQSAAAFTESLSAVLDDATYNGDAAATSGTADFTSPDLSWSGALAAGASATVTYSVTVRSPDPGDKTLTGTVVSATGGANCASGSGDARCTAAVTVLIPGLTITSAADVTSTIPTGVVHYTFTVANTGQTAYTGVVVTPSLAGTLAAATYGNDAAASSGSVSYAQDGTITWTGDLATGATATITASVRVNNPRTGGPALTTAVVSNAPGSTCPAGGGAPACSTSVPILDPRLTLSKIADRTTVTPGGTISYTVTAVNTGPTTYTGASFTDSLATVLNDANYNDDASATSGTVGYNAPTVTWTGDLAPGASATITYSVTVKDPDPGDKLPANQIVSSTLGADCAPGATGPGCSVIVKVLVPALTITKSAGSGTIVPGGTASYTMVITNTGETAYTGATVTDSLAGLLDDATYNGDASATTGTVGYGAPALTWQGDLAPGAAARITYSVTALANGTGDGLLTSTASSAAAGSNCVSGGTDARCTATVTLARLLLTQAYEQTSTTPGAVVRLNATFTNTGRTPYTGIRITAGSADVVDDAVPNGDQTASSGTLVLAAAGITWTGDIPVGGTVTVTGTLTIKNPATGDRLLSGTQVTTAPGSNCGAGSGDPRCTATLPVLLPELSIDKSADSASIEAGGTAAYTITIHNTGQTPYTGASVRDDLSGLLDDAVYNADAVTTSGSLSYASPILTWTGDLAVGETATITYTVTALDPDPGDKRMRNVVSSTAAGSTCPPGSGALSCSATVIVRTPALTIVKTADRETTRAGETVKFTVTVTNTGQTAYTGARFSDDLTGLLDDAAYGGDAAATSGTVSYAEPVVGWTGDLALEASATITYTVVVDNPVLGDELLKSVLTSPTRGSNCAAGGTDPRCSASVPVTATTDLTFLKTSAPSGSALRGGTITYTIKISNAAPAPYVGASFTDPLTAVLDDAAYNADAAADAGILTYTAPDLSWEGDVPGEGSVTITYSVKVNPAKTGDDILEGTLVSPSAGGNCAAASGDPRCTARVTVTELTIEESASSPTTTPGSVVSFTSRYTNTGQTPLLGAKVFYGGSDLIDDATPSGDVTASSGTVSIGADGLTWTGDIPVGGTVTLFTPFSVNAVPTGNKLIRVTAVSDTPGATCPAGATDSRCSSTITVLVPHLTGTKTADSTVSEPGDTVNYTIVLDNDGQTPYTGITLADSLSGVLDDAVYNTDAAATSGAVTLNGQDLRWTGDVPVGGTVTITYSLTIRDPDPGDKVMVNRITVDAPGSTCGTVSSADACTALVRVLTPGLTIVRSPTPASTVPGAVVGYEVVVTNTGQTTYAPASFTHALADVLDDAVINGDISATAGSAALNGTDLTWSGALSPGDSATVTFSVTVRRPDPGNRNLADAIVSTDPGGNCAAGTGPQCSGAVPVTVLTISVATDTATAIPTQVVRYTATLTNDGKLPYVGANTTFSFVGALDDATYNSDGTATSGSLTFNLNGTVTWAGDLAVGQSVVITATLTVNNPASGDRTMTAFASSSTPGSTCPAGPAPPECTTSVAVLIPSLAITKSADRSTAAPGETVAYTVTVVNTGPAAYTGATYTDSLAGVLDDADYTTAATADTGAISYTAPALTWTGDLAVGGSATITYAVTVKDPDPGDKRMTNTVTSATVGANCAPGNSDARCSTETKVLVPALTLVKSASAPTVVAGGVITYRITVSNTGETAYPAAAFSESLAGIVDEAAYNGDAAATSGTVGYAGSVLSWSGALGVGASATVTYSVTAFEPSPGDASLTGTVVSATSGNNCPAGGSDARCTVTTQVVPQQIQLTGLAAGFTLSGLPETTVRGDGAVSLTVVTNSPGGYTVSVRAVSPALTAPGTDQTIPVSRVRVREVGTGVFQPLSTTDPVSTFSKAAPSAESGDALTDDYEVDIPFVPSGRYSGTIDYIATTR